MCKPSQNSGLQNQESNSIMQIKITLVDIFTPSLTKTIDRTIRHLKLSFQTERPPPSHVAHQELLMAAEESGEYFLGNSGLFFSGSRAEFI
jgi:hypothetical protein